MAGDKILESNITEIAEYTRQLGGGFKRTTEGSDQKQLVSP